MQLRILKQNTKLAPDRIVSGNKVVGVVKATGHQNPDKTFTSKVELELEFDTGLIYLSDSQANVIKVTKTDQDFLVNVTSMSKMLEGESIGFSLVSPLLVRGSFDNAFAKKLDRLSQEVVVTEEPAPVKPPTKRGRKKKAK